MSEATYWVIVLAALTGALAIWLLTRTPAKPKRPRRLPPAPPEQPAAAVAPEPAAEPESFAEPEPEAEAAAMQPAGKKRGRPKKSAAAGPPDPLVTLKGLGPKAAARLNELGITRYDQIAAWTGEDIARIDPEMGAFKGRIVRDRWIEQAGYLAAGDKAGFEAKFGRLG